MKDVMHEINATANLVGTNRLELLLFSLNQKSGEESQLFGINVFKVKELLTVPKLRSAPMSADHIKGLANIRGSSIPVIDLMEYCGFQSETPANILLLTEYNNTSQGFLVHDVDNIVRLAWSDVHEPPDIFLGVDSAVVTGVSEIEDGRLVLILDIEKILADVLGNMEDKAGNTIDMATKGSLKSKTVFFADDSAVARKQLENLLGRMGAAMIISTDGGQAWEMLQKIADQADEEGKPVSHYIDAIITDVEMPRMDGYMLTKHVKDDPRFSNIPVIMHTSLSSDSNKRLGENAGVDTYVTKFNPKQISDTLESLLQP